MEAALQHEFMINDDSAAEKGSVLDGFPRSSHVEWPSFPWDSKESSLNDWEYQRRVLIEEFPVESPSQIVSWLSNLLKMYVNLEKDFVARIAKSKQRDDTKGAATIPDFAEFHVPVDNDPVVKEAHENLEKTEAMVNTILSKLQC
jgi:hypothetical protein